ncbi:MAG: glycosyl hydrolase family 18 protein [Caulobacteraceae bacterium]
MRKKKQNLIILFITSIFIVGMLMPAFAASTTTDTNDAPLLDKQEGLRELLYVEDNSYYFKDIANYWAKASLYELSYMDILKGYGDNTIRPDLAISREEYVALLVRALGLPVSDTYEQSYTDITEKNWSSKYIAAAKNNGLLTIFPGYYFYPYKKITREEVAVITAKAVEGTVATGEKLSFKDVPQYYRYKDSIDRVSELGIVTGLPNGNFDPKGNFTRAQAAVVIQRVLNTTNPAKETADQSLESMAVNYGKSIIVALNTGDYSFTDPLSLSIGRENKLNSKTADLLKYNYSTGSLHTKNINSESAQVLSKSQYLAKVELSYVLTIGDDEISSEVYSFKKQVLLKNLGDGQWAVYNSVPEFGSDIIGAGDKINMTWQYIDQATPDMSNVKKINGMNVISPTWFTLANEQGSLSDRASLAYTSWAHKNGYEVWALVDNGFNSSRTSLVLNNAVLRSKLENDIISKAKQYRIDGINIDFENMYTKDKIVFTQFMKELSQKAKANNLVLSVDVSVITSNSNWSECFDRAALAKVVDYMAVMAYDQHWDGSPVSGSVAQLSWVEDSVKRILQEVPRGKLLLGVPFYTRLWKEVYVNGKLTVTSTAISMEKAERIIADNNAVKTWDAVSGQYYATYKSGGATYKIWLEDERSIQMKAQLVNKYQLAGIASWKYGLEKPAVWNVIASTLNIGDTY